MNDEYKDLSYYKFKKLQIMIMILGCNFTLLYAMTRKVGENVNFYIVILLLLVPSVIVAVMSFMRRMIILGLSEKNLDFKTVYDLEHRKDKGRHKVYNLQLLANCHFISGDFEELISCTQNILSLSNVRDACYARHLQIITYFIIGRYDEALDLIKAQEEAFHKIKKKSAETYNIYYMFIKLFLSGEYADAVEELKKFFSDKNFDALNSRKIIVYYLMRSAYVKLNDRKNVQLCTNEIIKCDPYCNSFFRKTVESDRFGEGSSSAEDPV